jgi:hypothetical protein
MNIESDVKDFIGVYKNAFSKEYCDSVIKYFEDLSAAGLVVNRQMSEDISKCAKDDEHVFSQESAKLNYCGDLIRVFNTIFWKEIYPRYANEFAILKELAGHNNYSFKVQKTKVGGGYHIWHTESSNRESSVRMLAWTLYLNDVDEGGETEFLYYPRRIKAEAGKFIIWPTGFPHTHRGNPPLSNTKYIVTGWTEF